jgi:hypothetical protein
MTGQLNRVVAVWVALCAAPAAAETLPVSGVYPAGNDTAASLSTIAIEPFGGADGQQLAIAVGDKLRAATIDGEPYFRIVPGGSGARYDAVLQGTASAEADRRDSGTRDDDVCVERDDDHHCTKKEKRKIPCWDRVVRLVATVRLVGAGGAPIDGLDREDEQTQRWCEGDDRPSTEAMTRQLAGLYADDLRAELAPVQRSEQVRVMETRKGLLDDDSRAFRDAVRLTKTDIEAACAAWSVLETRNPDYPAILFNLGLCAESRGDLKAAYDYYRHALAADHDTGYAQQGVGRIEGRWRANAQLESRHRP